MRAHPSAALCGLEAQESRRVTQRLGKPPDGRRRLGAILAARSAVSPDTIPHPWRPWALIHALVDTPGPRRSGAQSRTDCASPADQPAGLRAPVRLFL